MLTKWDHENPKAGIVKQSSVVEAKILNIKSLFSDFKCHLHLELYSLLPNDLFEMETI